MYKSGPSGYLRTAAGALLNGTANASNMSNLKDAYTTQNDANQTQRGIKTEWRKGGEVVGWMAGVDIRRDEDRAYNTNLLTYSSSAAPTVTAANLNLAGAVVANNVIATKTNGAYGEAKWQVSQPLTSTLNLRYDDIATSYDSYLPLTGAGKLTSGRRVFNVWSERLGFNYALSDTQELYTNVSNGFRVPTATQLYGSTISPTSTVLANPDLRPERSWNKEIGLRTKDEWLGVAVDTDVAFFVIDRNDFILNTGGQYQTTPLTSGTEQYQNIGGVRNRGVEMSIKTDAHREWSQDMAYTWLDARFTRNDAYWMSMGPRSAPLPSVYYNNTGNIVPRTPKHKLSTTTRYRPVEALTLSAEVNAESGIFADEVNIVWVGGHTVFNLMANYEIHSEQGVKWSTFGRIDNVFNHYYYTTIRGSSDSNGDGVYNAEDPSIVVNAGRVWTVGATAKF